MVRQDVITEVIHGGSLAEHQGINLPGVAVSAPALTEKDRVDLIFGVEQGVDYIALSFVRRPEDVSEAKALVAETLRNLPHPCAPSPRELHPSAYAAERVIPIIAKLEKPEAIEALDAILEVADGVMVARGDLGVELPLEQVPMIQKHIIARANARGLPVITATQMLESMIDARAAHARRGQRRRQRHPRWHRRRDAQRRNRRGRVSGRGGAGDARASPADR